jgi:leader peptidase (prepilin peptidase)/N-methyltransferase
MVLLTYFGVVFVIDVEHRLIMHPVSWIGMILCFGAGWYLHGIWNSILGGFVGYLIMLAFYYLGDVFGRWLSQRRGEEYTEVALGFGDVNLSGILGLILGWPGVLVGLLLAILMGGIFSVMYIIGKLIMRRYQAFSAIPYGPFLIASAVLLLYFKDVIKLIFP